MITGSKNMYHENQNQTEQTSKPFFHVIWVKHLIQLSTPPKSGCTTAVESLFPQTDWARRDFQLL